VGEGARVPLDAADLAADGGAQVERDGQRAAERRRRMSPPASNPPPIAAASPPS
jgi:hypothetical protein